MNDNKTLREVCEHLHISRRVIQGYEKHGLVKASSRNKYNHLLYDTVTIQRIALIRFMQTIGFSLIEIKSFIDCPHDQIQAILHNQVKMKQNDLSKIHDQIDKTLLIINAYDKINHLEEIYKIIQGEDYEKTI